MDTNECERSIRPIAVYINSCGSKQSFEYLRSYCNWLSLRRTAEANGIKHPATWLKRFHRAFFQFCLDESLTMREKEKYTGSVNLQSFYPEAIAKFDFTPWMAWNYQEREELEEQGDSAS